MSATGLHARAQQPSPAVAAAGAPVDGAEDGGEKKRRPAEQGGDGGGGKKARKALLAASRAAVEAANRGLRVREPSEHQTTSGQTVQLHMHGQLERGALLLSWVAALVEENMRALYERGWGWDGSLSLSL